MIGYVALDVFRTPNRQITPRAYRSAVGAYQWAKPRCGFEGCCRFEPTCSRYSADAVEQHGILKGLDLTIQRIDRCKTNVPLGTYDPVRREINNKK